MRCPADPLMRRSHGPDGPIPATGGLSGPWCLGVASLTAMVDDARTSGPDTDGHGDDDGARVLDDEPGPEELDPELWFACADHPGERDLVVGNAHTFLGRILAVCPQDDGRHYYASANAVLEDCAPATRFWVQGFLAGSEPPPPRGADGGWMPDDSAEMASWRRRIRLWRTRATWPDDD